MTDPRIPSKSSEAFRLAIRQEGLTINAYLAPINTMEGAMHIASISRALCELDSSVFEDFKRLMAKGVEALAKAQFGADAVLGTAFRPAPEHEKAGHA